jgi:hypothetical protein
LAAGGGLPLLRIQCGMVTLIAISGACCTGAFGMLSIIKSVGVDQY